MRLSIAATTDRLFIKNHPVNLHLSMYTLFSLRKKPSSMWNLAILNNLIIDTKLYTPQTYTYFAIR